MLVSCDWCNRRHEVFDNKQCLANLRQQRNALLAALKAIITADDAQELDQKTIETGRAAIAFAEGDRQ
jgi:hypothetical protein